MTNLTPSSSGKRPCSDDEASTSELSTCNASSAKRQCTSLPEKVQFSRLRLLIPGKDIPPTPSPSVAGASTMALKLTAPQEPLTRDELAKSNRHKSDAERWKPKLQRPYPSKTEIKRAYPLKLLRHYPDSSVHPLPDFQRPKVDTSPRVSRLLQHFPLPSTTNPHPLTTLYPTPSPVTPASRAVPLSARVEDLKRACLANHELQWNKYLTQTDHAQHLAWQAFSHPEQGRIDRGRECMVHSGLDEEDLWLENMGLPNGLPDWKRPWTGRFVEGVPGWPETQMQFYR